MTIGTSLNPYISTEAFISKKVEESEKSTLGMSGDLALSNANKAFLLEGLNPNSFLQNYHELELAMDFAKSNQVQSFDCIQSYSRRHLSCYFEAVSLRDHINIAINIIDFMSSILSPSETIDKIIKPGIEELILKGIYLSMPEWVDSLKDDDYFLNSVAKIKENFASEDEMCCYFSEITRTLIKTSNQISVGCFFEYLRDHPEVNEIYAMVGARHLDFLNDYAEKIDSKTDENHLQIAFLERTIIVHLFGGTHGNLTHFESMSTFAVQAGSSLHPLSAERKMDLKIETSLIKILSLGSIHLGDASIRKETKPLEATESRSNTAQQKDASIRKAAKPLEAAESRLNTAQQRFDYWMKNYIHYGEKNHAESLLDWLSCDYGAELISNYDEFIQLSQILDGNGYEIKKPSQDQFDVALRKFALSKARSEAKERTGDSGCIIN